MLVGNFCLLGPEPEPAFSSRIQDAVVERLAAMSRESILMHAAATADCDAMAWHAVLEGLAPERRRAVMLHPTFRYWLQGMRRSVRTGPDKANAEFSSHLRDLIWAEAVLAGCAPSPVQLVTDDRGGVRCPSRGRHIELGSAYVKRAVQVIPCQGEILLRTEDGMERRLPHADLASADIETPLPTIEANGYDLTLYDTLAHGQIQVGSRDEWLRAKLSGTNQRNDGIDFYQVDDELYPTAPPLDTLALALQRLHAHWPEAYADLRQFVQVIVPIRTPVATRLSLPGASEPRNCAFTVSSRQGAIYVGNAQVDETIEMLLHEFAHVKLRQIQAIDPLLEDPLDESIRVHVPWRADKRPLPGVMEGLFVFMHVAESELRRVACGAHALAPVLQRRLQGLRFAASCLKSHARLTAAGQEFLQWMDAWTSSLDRRYAPAMLSHCVDD
ncbi:aKG-HExxH-type peptide beta-hydroxylase [Duganella violaceipulchra]|uniref:HEXXH motif domain-containing protein n=1 Tax=Duganella violaceipulchra TaxID=2849652 RepID=A0AA41HA05_9BURK|nr:HEXXH motif-containing putative peptide modification protein [Duganella violaceicalia]MBV6323429.1 hypothetical protein [Duganella violaceicalia]MCP2007617.1 hypothetical protein [Duganella violaceicalia]